MKLKIHQHSILIVAIAVVAGAVFSSCSEVASSDQGHVLSKERAKALLLDLPYRYRFRQISSPEGASGALAGWVENGKGVGIQFGISLGRQPAPVSVPNAGTKESYGYPKGGFVYADDLQVPAKNGKWVINERYRTPREWHEASEINISIQEKLCKAATGKPCPP